MDTWEAIARVLSVNILFFTLADHDSIDFEGKQHLGLILLSAIRDAKF